MALGGKCHMWRLTSASTGGASRLSTGPTPSTFHIERKKLFISLLLKNHESSHIKFDSQLSTRSNIPLMVNSILKVTSLLCLLGNLFMLHFFHKK